MQVHLQVQVLNRISQRRSKSLYLTLLMRCLWSIVMWLFCTFLRVQVWLMKQYSLSKLYYTFAYIWLFIKIYMFVLLIFNIRNPPRESENKAVHIQLTSSTVTHTQLQFQPNTHPNICSIYGAKLAMCNWAPCAQMWKKNNESPHRPPPLPIMSVSR